ncbi:hypothetical protein [Bacteroides thetaiotaomicron]|uniref:Glycosyltransferase family 2 protein n=1 Tax=Bacteroides thetaiotaomicron TaxID=818 RepID=A0AAW4ZBA7_BACT4|nr:hypothetical protein [Bacteroides thetaiotaomicron]MCE9239297.1 hypothetical protein [Bacteroides thetaiotaomicron]MCE9277509.1 hypothetical protein [Bacteroides thetaiotaomicron]MCE9292374.1 hypothetical protein [Bacteroides thetaiotaomicron]
MKAFQKIKKLYGKLSIIDNIVYNRVVRQNYHNLFLNSTEVGTTNETYSEGQLIVSLTSYGNKLQLVYLTIESLLHQTVKPNKIILWLDQTKYNIYESIPMALHKQEERGLEIRLCEDVGSYTKLVPALLNYPDAVIISADDDIIYPIDFVERLYRAYQKDLSKIYFYRGHYILFNEDGSPKPYLEWVARGAKGCDIYNFPTGVSGIIYPPHCYHEDMTNKVLFLKLCPHADDVWFKAMTMLKGTLCEQIPTPHFDSLFVPLDIDETSSLQSINVVNGGNDKQIKAVFDYYHIKNEL